MEIRLFSHPRSVQRDFYRDDVSYGRNERQKVAGYPCHYCVHLRQYDGLHALVVLDNIEK